jgi:uncharacterized alpha/beta hydrolase family protein
MKKIFIEIFLILTIAFFLAFIYNSLSPEGLRILPRKEVNKSGPEGTSLFSNQDTK